MGFSRSAGLAACALLAGWIACSDSVPGPPDAAAPGATSASSGAGGAGGRVLVVGIDGASPRITAPLLQAGRLPHLAAIAARGVHSRLRAHKPITSPRIWTSMATGMGPNRHGIKEFGYKDDAGVRHLFTSTERQVPALWNIASAAGRKVSVVNWWNTYPVERIRGVLVSDHLLASDVEGRRRITGALDPTAGPVAWPPEWNERVHTLLSDDTPLTTVPNPFAQPEALPGWARPERLSRRFENDADVVRIALAIEAAERPELMLVFLPGIDRVSHVLWATIEPESAYRNPLPMTSETRAAGAEALHAYYAYTDALIGRLLERYGEGDRVLVVSDHGFEAGQKLGYLTGVHESDAAIDGVLFAAGPGIEAVPGPIPSVNDVTPTVLALMGLPAARDMEGRPAAFVAREDVVFVESHRDTPVDRLAAQPSGAEAGILLQLEALGYIEPEGEAEAETPE